MQTAELDTVHVFCIQPASTRASAAAVTCLPGNLLQQRVDLSLQFVVGSGQ